MVNFNPSLISNASYRTYVSDKEKDFKTKPQKKGEHFPPNVLITPKYRSGPIVKNSHLEQSQVSFIIPYQHKGVQKSSFIKHFETAPVYVGMSRYNRLNLPHKLLPHYV